jgi:hypothetical protein
MNHAKFALSASYFQEKYSMLISKDKIMLRLRWIVLLVFCLAIILLMANRTAGALIPDQKADTPPFTPKDAGQFNADVPVAWFDLAYELARSEGLTPPVAARTFGYLGVTLYEAVVPGMPGYQSLAGQLNGLEPLPGPTDPAHHWPTVANSALAAVLGELLPGTETAVQAQEAYFVAQFQSDLPPGIFQRSVARGQAIGQAIGQWAEADGYAALHNCPYSPPVGEGLWTPTPPGLAPALQPCWGQVRPFVLADGSECNPGPPPAYSEEPDSLFYQEAWEVYSTVNNLTPEQLTIALYWADDPGLTGTPPGHSLSILSQVLVQQEAALGVAAEAYARVGMAVADAFIACWWTKYEYNLLRPITYVHEVLADPAWTTPVNTPPFPEYTSGHSVQSAATAQVLTGLFGEMTFADHTHGELGLAPRTFTTFFAYAEEAAISRLYGGIHFRSAIELGIEQGKCIGERVNALQFRSE